MLPVVNATAEPSAYLVNLADSAVRVSLAHKGCVAARSWTEERQLA